jgi:HAMP domain-containing protein
MLGPRGRRWVFAFVVGLIPLVVWLAVVGPDGITRLLDDLAASRPGRRLPLPELQSVEGGLLLSTFVVLAGSIVASVLWLRRDARNSDARVLLSISLLLLALLPSTLQRADAAHVIPTAAIAIGLAPVVAVALLDLHPGGWARAGLALAGLVLAVTLGHVVESKVTEQVDSLSESGHEIANGERSFRVADPVAASDLELMVAEVERLSEPGDSIFVGTSDLTRTVYGDTFVYFLLPDLVPASFYTELNPGTANAEGSDLAEELERADFLLLTDRWEPDTDEAGEAGSDAAQEVVDERFCPAAEAGYYELLVPCSRISGSASER